MTPVEERFQRIETNIEKLTQAMILTDGIIGKLTQSISAYVDANDARAKHLDESLEKLTATVDRSVASADARMKQIEANLDGLIRAITREHSNGKGKE